MSHHMQVVCTYIYIHILISPEMKDLNIYMCVLIVLIDGMQGHRDRILNWMIPSSLFLALGLALDLLGKITFLNIV